MFKVYDARMTQREKMLLQEDDKMSGKFKIYMRECKRCGDIFRCKSKRGSVCLHCMTGAQVKRYQSSIFFNLKHEVKNATFV